jgi:hypothetical protein
MFRNNPEQLADVCPSHHLGYKKSLKLDPCVYCGEPSDSLEHVIPQKDGGRSAYNIVGACKKCNSTRRHTPFLIWMIERTNGYTQTQSQ